MSETTKLPARIQRIGSVVSAVFFLAMFVFLHSVAVDYSETPRLFPLLVIRIGIVISAMLVLKETVVQWYAPGFLSKEEDEVQKYLTGTGSQFTLSKRATRLAILGGWTVAFFVLGSVNVLLALPVCYAGVMWSLGIRNYKLIAASTVVIWTFVFVVFVLIIGMPLGVF